MKHMHGIHNTSLGFGSSTRRQDRLRYSLMLQRALLSAKRGTLSSVFLVDSCCAQFHQELLLHISHIHMRRVAVV